MSGFGSCIAQQGVCIRLTGMQYANGPDPVGAEVFFNSIDTIINLIQNNASLTVLAQHRLKETNEG